MANQRLNQLELTVVAIETSMGSLTEKMNTVADALTTLGNAMAQLAVYDTKILHLEKDLSSVRDETRISKSDGVKRSIMGFSAGITVVTFLFGYLYADLAVQEEHRKIDSARINKMATDIEVIKERLKKANAHRYKVGRRVNKELLDTYIEHDKPKG